MGHKTVSMTVRYAHPAPEHQLAAVQKLCRDSQAAQSEATDTKTDTRTPKVVQVAGAKVQ